jgi:hypothetical protein
MSNVLNVLNLFGWRGGRPLSKNLKGSASDNSLRTCDIDTADKTWLSYTQYQRTYFPPDGVVGLVP